MLQKLQIKAVSSKVIIIVVSIAMVDLKNIHEIYEQIKVDYPEYSERFQLFGSMSLFGLCR